MDVCSGTRSALSSEFRPIFYRGTAAHRDVTEAHTSRSLTASAAITVVGSLMTTIRPLAAKASAAFTGSVVTSGLLGILSASRSMQLFRQRGSVNLPAAVLRTIFGIWFIMAPLLYEVRSVSTPGTQFAGMLVASFALYLVVTGLSRSSE